MMISRPSLIPTAWMLLILVVVVLAPLPARGATATATAPTASASSQPLPADALAAQVAAAAIPLTDDPSAYDPLLELIGDARIVMLGEETHGTEEFYEIRAEITRRLVEERGFDAVAVEANWPQALEVNRFVRGLGRAFDASQALAAFDDFPRWMWANEVVAEFVSWLRDHNGSRRAEDAVGFYGIDLQTLSLAIEVVVDFLTEADVDLADAALVRYGCLAPYREEPVAYAEALLADVRASCAEEVAEQVDGLEAYARTLGPEGDRESLFSALQSARMLASAEAYFRAMAMRDVSTWNLRDEYMLEVITELLAHLDRPGDPARIVVWAHNSHVGDAGATERAEIGESNLGQLARRRWGDDVLLVGFTTYTGTVMAAARWDGEPQVMAVRRARPDSYANLFHRTGLEAFLLPLRDRRIGEWLAEPRLERAIGVVYRPQTERQSHYFGARLGEQFDAVIHIDETRALQPLPDRPRHESPGE